MENNVCTFFGHRDCPESVKPKLRAAIEELIHNGVDTFYVGDSGRFDSCALAVLKTVQQQHPHIRCFVVLSRLPSPTVPAADVPTLFPEGLETGPARFAIERRNQWLLQQADRVLCYVDRPYGGAFKFARLAKKKGKAVKNLADEVL